MPSLVGAKPPPSRAVKRGLYFWTTGHRRQLALGAVALLVTNALGYLVPLLIKHAVDLLGQPDFVRVVGWLAGGIFLVALAQAGARIASRLLIFNAARDIEQQLRERLFRHLLALSPARLGRHSIGDLQSRLTNDLTNVRLLYGAGLLNMINTLVAYLIALPLMAAQSPRLTLVALAPYPIIVLLMRRVARRIFGQSTHMQERLGSLSNLVNEDLGARLFINAAGLGPLEERRFAAANDDYLQSNLVLARTRALMMPLMSMTGAAGTATALFLGGQEVIGGRMSVGSLVAFTSYVAMLAWPTLMFGFMIAMIQRGRASYARIAALFAEPVWEPGDGEIVRPPIGGPALHALSGRIALHELSVAYGEHRVLDRVSLDVPLGARLGIVGEVGSGKSTLLLALSRLLEVDRGAYTIDGHDVCDLPLASVRRTIGLVPQQPFLFSLSIADNIAFGHDQVTEDLIRQAARWADLDKDILSFAEGYHTLVGERGVTLSGGQKQRLALARALIGRPPILLLDDCFSAVDVDTERRIIEQLGALWLGRTVIIATHRLAVLEHVDRILVLERGQIVEQGTAAELLARPSRYAELHRRQRLRARLEHTHA